MDAVLQWLAMHAYNYAPIMIHLASLFADVTAIIFVTDCSSFNVITQEDRQRVGATVSPLFLLLPPPTILHPSLLTSSLLHIPHTHIRIGYGNLWSCLRASGITAGSTVSPSSSSSTSRTSCGRRWTRGARLRTTFRSLSPTPLRKSYMVSVCACRGVGAAMAAKAMALPLFLSILISS